MPKMEMRALSFITENKAYVFLGCITLLALGMRYSGLDYVSKDLSVFLLPWYEEFESLGFSALSEQIGNYNITYQTLIYIGTLLPIEPMIWYKSLSIVFDFVLAVEGYLLVKALSGKRLYAAIAYGLLLVLPTFWLNSSVWGQCDSIYVSFVLMAVRRLIMQKYASAYVLLGVAFAFKLQACFIFPFFIFYYLNQRGFSILLFLLPVVSFYAMCLPGFVAGRSLLAPLQIYFGQADAPSAMFLKYPSFWALVGDDFTTLKFSAIGFTLALLLIGFVVLLGKVKVDGSGNGRTALLVAAWFAWTCVQFLPGMHERYGYLVVVLLTLLLLVERRHVFFLVWLTVVVCDCLIYGIYLFGLDVNLTVCSVAMVSAWALLGLALAREVSRCSEAVGSSDSCASSSGTSSSLP